MDYSGLVASIKDGDEITTGKLCGEATPILKKYLIKKCGAAPVDAEDSIQKMYEYIIVKIRDDKIKNPSGLLDYMLKTCRHNYIKMILESNMDYIQDMNNEPVSSANQLWALINEEEQEILKFCMEQLRQGYKEFISYWFKFPSASTDDIAEHFDISNNNAWIRKHRVVKKLSDCVTTQI